MINKLKRVNEKNAKILVIVTFILILITGMAVRDDYGVYCDYAPQTEVIFMNIQGYAKLFLDEDSGYVQGLGDRDILTDVSRDYGIAALYPIIPFSMIPKFRNDPHLWMLTLRAIVFFVFWLGLIAQYLLTKKITGSRLYGLISVFLLWLTPRFFAEGTYNNKDTVTLACTTILLYAGYEFLFNKKHSVLWTVLFAFTAAVSTNERVTGLILYGVIGLSFLILIIIRKEVTAKNFAKGIAAIILMPVFYVILTPATWYGNLISSVMYRLDQSSNFVRTPVDVMVKGEIYNSILCSPGASYPFRYMLITIPPVILLFFFAGLITTCVKAGKKADDSSYFRYLMLGFMIIFFITLIVGKPSLYNGWRQIFFVYPFIVIFSVLGIYDISKKGIIPASASWCITAVQLVVMIGFIVLNHPVEFNYYNFLAGGELTENWEGDYWGTGMQYTLDEVSDRFGPCYVVSPTPAFLRLNLEHASQKTKENAIFGGDDWASFLRSDYIIVNTYVKLDFLKLVDAEWSEITESDVALYRALDETEPVMVVKCGSQVLYEVYANPYK